MRPAGLFVVSIRKTGGPTSALQRSDAGGSIWASPLYTTKHLFRFMHFFYSNSWSVQVPVYAVRHDHAEVACPGLGWQFPPHSRGRLAVPATQPGAAVLLCGGTGVQAEREAAILQPHPRQNPHNATKVRAQWARTFVANLWWR